MKKTNPKRVIHLENICKSYNNGRKEIKVLKDVNIDFFDNNFYAIKGHSGSGKTTLINILGLIDKYDNGTYELYDIKSIDYSDKSLSKLRMKNIGFVFQGMNLDPYMKAYENVMVPMLINKEIDAKERKEKAIELLKKVGLEDRVNHYPRQMSGGEQQRVAMARALANNPSIILADEPTGNLDETTEKEIFAILKELSKNGKCVIVVSHSNYVKEYADKVFYIKSGNIVGENL